ncbi:DUF4105 domain-containing protein [Denitrificimonas caeni]|uniref:DUF4105 domain-containing protein n=1 Tax=Denitrificimonas caeni TaxID=521720 RepID=A0AAF0AJ68_9GAMM|nr:DUF4105 domain-containing protein [Denitrificimonas caeni]WBE25719.1 DUF4105 domain-containing protein [Denitrificimonas caeni]
MSINTRAMLSAGLKLLLSLFILCAALWGSLALYYQLPLPMPWLALALLLWLGLTVLALLRLWRISVWQGFFMYLVMHAALLTWWYNLTPSNQHLWEDDVAQMTYGEVQGNQVTLYNVRNFDWHSETDYTARWETRHYDLSKLTSVDMLTSHWGMDAIAHVLVSFGFADDQFVTFSVEIRKKQGQQFSEVAGFFKQYELSILATDERDAIAVRPNVRGEDTYLYRIDMPAAIRRQLFLSYIEQANQLLEEPRFYNTVTANCTTLVFGMMQHISGGLPLDSRLLLTGYLPSYVAELDGLTDGFDLAQLRTAGRITERSKQAQQSPNYSKIIREGVPGW